MKQTSFEEALQTNIVIFIINMWLLIFYLFFSNGNVFEYKIIMYFWTVFLLITLFFQKNRNLAIFWLFLGIIVAILVHLFAK